MILDKFLSSFSKLQSKSFIEWNKNRLHLYIHIHKSINVNKLVDKNCCLLEKSNVA